MFNYLWKSILSIGLFVVTGAVMGCTMNQPPPPPPGPPPGQIGEVAKFDIMEASPEDIANALQRDGRVIISGGILFETDSAKLTPNAEGVASRIATVMTQNPNMQVAVVGYTDSTGNFNYNIQLSKRRADAIVNQLVKDGIARDRLAGVGVGPLNPIATNDTAEGRAQNRRVELVLIR